MRICIWHGWLLEGTGSNVYTARVAEVLRAAGHDVVLLCQEPHPDRFNFVDAWGTVGHDVFPLVPNRVPPAAGRVTLLRTQIGSLLPVFVYDEYEGFDAKRFVDLTDLELEIYIECCAQGLRAALAWHGSEVVIAGHAIPGGEIARRGAGEGNYVVKTHGSDVEYAIKLQDRYLQMARTGLAGARAVTGSGEDVLQRVVDLVPEVAGRTLIVHPGVDLERFKPRPRKQALEHVANLLSADAAIASGRGARVADGVARALAERDARALDTLATSYDQTSPDPGAPTTLRNLMAHGGPTVGYIGKLIPQKGVERLIEATALIGGTVRVPIVGFGTFREWLAALVHALDLGDVGAYEWLSEQTDLQLELSPDEVASAAGIGQRISFTGRLDHRYAPWALAALDVLVVPSTMSEAFGMVAIEGAAAGALPLVSRHSGLAEVAGALENEAERPGLFSFEPGAGATRRLAEGLERLLSLSAAEKTRLRNAVRAYVSREWTWERTAQRLLEAAR